MNPVQYAINSLKHEIPPEVLEYAFGSYKAELSRMRWGQDPRAQSLDSVIRAKVIEARVHLDINLVGGTEHQVDLRSVHREKIDDRQSVYRIPYDMTMGRTIIGCQSVSYYDFNILSDHSGNEFAGAAIDVYRASTSMPTVETTNIEILADNIILVRDDGHVVDKHYILTCTVENDASLQNLPKGAYKHYARLVALATKAYIYTNTTVHMDRGALHYGQNIGRIREVIDDYRDANREYQDYYDQYWGKVAFFSDRSRVSKFIKAQIGRWK